MLESNSFGVDKKLAAELPLTEEAVHVLHALCRFHQSTDQKEEEREDMGKFR